MIKLRFGQVNLFPQGQMLNEKQNSIGTLPSPARPLHLLLQPWVKTNLGSAELCESRAESALYLPILHDET